MRYIRVAAAIRAIQATRARDTQRTVSYRDVERLDDRLEDRHRLASIGMRGEGGIIGAREERGMRLEDEAKCAGDGDIGVTELAEPRVGRSRCALGLEDAEDGANLTDAALDPDRAAAIVF